MVSRSRSPQVGFERQHRRVEAAPLHQGHEGRGLVLHPLRRQAREPSAQDRHDLGQEIGRDRGDDPEAQSAAQRVAEAGGGPGQVRHLEQDPPRAVHHLAAGRGDQHLLAVPLEEAHAEGPLQLRHLGAQRRLRHVAEDRGPVEVPGLGDGHRVLQLPQRDRGRGQAHDRINLSH